MSPAARSGQSSHGLARKLNQVPKIAAAPARSRASRRFMRAMKTRARAMHATASDAPRPKAPTRSAWSASRPTSKTAAMTHQVASTVTLRLAHAGM